MKIINLMKLRLFHSNFNVSSSTAMQAADNTLEAILNCLLSLGQYFLSKNLLAFQNYLQS